MHLAAAAFLILIGLTTMPELRAEGLFNYQGKNYKEDSLSPAAKQALFEIQFENYMRIKDMTEQTVLDMYLDQESAKQKKSKDELKKKLFDSPEPNDKEMKEFYEKNKERIPYPFEQVKDQLKGHMKQEKTAKAQKDLIEKVKKNGNFTFNLSEPTPPTFDIKTDGFATKGNTQAKVTLIEFADYQCPHCREAFETFEKVWPEFKDKVRFVFIDYPINPSGISKYVAQGAFCAGKQNKFWEFHESAFKRQSELSKESPKKFADELKLDRKGFDACLDSKEAVQFVDKAKEEGDRIGIRGTPSIYLNGKRYAHSHEPDQIREAIKALL